MTLAAPPTLADLRTSVAVRLGFGPQAAQSEAQVGLLDEWIRRAARELFLEAPWVSLRLRIEIPLTTNVSIYDIPDGFEVGNIDRVILVSEDGREQELGAGVRPYERSLWAESQATMPQRYEFIDGEMRLYPKPDATRFPTLLIEGKSTSPDPRQPDDLVPLDDEAVIQWAVAIGKKHLGTADAAVADRDARLYVARVRPTQSDGSSIQIGGHFSRKFLMSTRRTRAADRDRYFHLNWTPRL